MKTEMKDGTFVIILDERIDSANSEALEEEMLEAVAEHPDAPLCLDAVNLTYISSSGLRILVRLMKEGQDDLTLINVAPEIYEVLEISGITTLMKVRRKMHQISVEGCEVIGEGAFGTVYKINEDTAVKVYREGEASIPIIEKETIRARQAFVSGVPTAIPCDIVQVGDQYGSVFEMINAGNCSDMVMQDPSALDELIPQYASFLKALHGMEVASGELDAARDMYLQDLEVFASCLSAQTAARLKQLLEDMPPDHHLIHGDVQLKNVMVSNGEMIVIDMDHMCTGDPAFEFAGLYATYIAFNEDEPDNTLKFLGLDEEISSRIFRETLRTYLGEEEDYMLAEKKVRVLGYLRFLRILLIEMVKLHNPLKDLRIAHTAEALDRLAYQVDALSL